MKRLILFLLFLVSLYWVSKWTTAATEGFSVARIRSLHPFNPVWEGMPLSEKESSAIHAILNQKFHYLTRGGQSFVFLSEDGQYVLKFFKNYAPFPVRMLFSERLKSKMAQKRNRDFSAYRLAFDELRTESALLFIHFNLTRGFSKKVTISDPLHIEHEIELNEFPCILQKRADLTYHYLAVLIEKKERKKAEEAIEKIIALILLRCERGIYDEDPWLHRNSGFLEDHPIFLDPGRLVKNPEMKSRVRAKKELKRIMGRFKKWLVEQDPSLATFLEEKIDAL